MRLAFQAAARKAGVCIRTAREYRRDGMIVEMVDGRLYVQLEDILAWKRWRGLHEAAVTKKREKAAREGVVGARVAPSQREREFQEWIKAGGRP